MKMLKAGIDRSLREPDPVPEQPFAQLREREPAMALVTTSCGMPEDQ